MTHNVQIPKGYFFKQSKQEYADVYTRLIQELVQNSVDAGAKNIYLDFTDEGYSCADDGKGMDEQTLVNGMLTFGGSIKEEGTCGNFGYAKVLILFSMESFIIQTRNNLASGEGLNYSLDTEALYYQGTKISCKFPQNWGNGKYQMVGYAERFLSKCQLRCNVYINGVQFTNWDYVTRSIRHNEWSKLYCSKTEGTNYYITVRKNGLFMFQKYVGEIKKKIVLEVLGSSKDVFTANRDGFRQEQDKEFQALYSEIVIDKKSFDKKGSRKHVFKGRKAFNCVEFSDNVLVSKVRVAGTGQFPVQVVVAIDTIHKLIQENNVMALKDLAKKYEHSDMEVEGRKIHDIARDAADAIQAFFDNDFIVDLGDSEHTDVPKRYTGITMSVRNQNIAKLWKAALLFAIEANRLNVKFRIGFTLNSDRLAQFSRTDGVDEYLINPEKDEFNEVPKWEKVYNFAQIAVHELVHGRGLMQHDEEFVSVSEGMMVKTLTAMKGDANVLSKKAKDLKI